MKDDARALCAALDGEEALASGGAAADVRLLQLATEVESSFAIWKLPPAAREGIWLRAMTMAGESTPPPPGLVTVSRRPSLAHPGRLVSALIGGTAVVAVAAIGATVVRQRRAHGASA